jgi:hypothetical protein
VPARTRLTYTFVPDLKSTPIPPPQCRPVRRDRRAPLASVRRLDGVASVDATRDNVAVTQAAPLFLAEGQPSELDLLLLAEELGPGPVKGGQADLTLPFREPSHFSIGDPIVSPLTSTGATPAELRNQFDEYEFYQVQLACSFQAAPACRFTDARFAVVLTTTPEGSTQGSEVAADAIAYDLFPLLLEDAKTVTVKSTVKPEVSFKFEPVTATLSLPSRERVEQQIRYACRVVAFDLRGTRPAWSFYRTEQHEISGPQRLFVLVRKSTGTRVQAMFSLRARVEFVLGGQGFSPVELVMLFRRRDQAGLITDELTVPLC